MHGHGDRPHLCWYPGCERGILGNGFPRRYNLFDHMKRVHDYKEDPASSTGSPVLGGESQGPKKSRKRKASVSPTVEPAPQRQRTMSLPQEQLQATSAIRVGYQQSPEYFQAEMYEPEQYRGDHHRQKILYSQWANQRELLARQIEVVHSPDDVDRFTQNVQEFRRLSDEVRRR